MSEKVYDALVIGSGAAGSFAAMELTANGLSVLLLEAGPEISMKDFDPTRKKPPASAINIWERARATFKGQPVQARAAFFTERFSRFFVNDRKNPYTTPRGEPFLWIRGRQSGGNDRLKCGHRATTRTRRVIAWNLGRNPSSGETLRSGIVQ